MSAENILTAARSTIESLATSYPENQVNLSANLKALGGLIDTAEELIGGNLQWFNDQLDLQVRQGDTDTIHRLEELAEAWKIIVCLSAQKPFEPTHHSVTNLVEKYRD